MKEGRKKEKEITKGVGRREKNKGKSQREKWKTNAVNHVS
jgi:hypothetical protein